MSLTGFNPSVSNSTESGGAKCSGGAGGRVSSSGLSGGSAGEGMGRSPVARNAVVHPIRVVARTGSFVLDYQI